MKFNVANRIYVAKKYRLNGRFQKIAEQKFDAGIQSLNFAHAADSAKTINKFVEDETENKIQNLISPDALDASTAVVIVNAIYMYGEWQHQFNVENTKPGRFAADETATYMHTEAKFNYARLSQLNAAALEMRYANSSFSVVILLPDEKVQLADVETRLTVFDWKQITGEMHERKVKVAIPKFKTEYQQNLNAMLSNVCVLI